MAFEYSSGAIVGSAFIKAVNETANIENAIDVLLKKLDR